VAFAIILAVVVLVIIGSRRGKTEKDGVELLKTYDAKSD
jgi:hypothetical protein